MTDDGDGSVPLPSIVVETGPLLCAGLLGRTGISILYQHFRGRILMPVAVESELINHMRRSPKPLADAAARVAGPRRCSFIVRDRTNFTSPQRRVVREQVLAAERRRGVNEPGKDHAGEVGAILLAEALGGAIVLTNDLSAADVASDHDLVVASWATVLAAEVRTGRIDGAEASQMCEQLEPTTFPGAHNTEPVDFATLAIPEGFGHA